MANFISNLGFLGSGFIQGLDQAAQLRDKATDLKIKQLKLDNDKIDAMAEAAAYKSFVGGGGQQGGQGGQPSPYAAPQGPQQQQGQQQPPGPVPGVSGLPGAQQPQGQPPPGSIGMPTLMSQGQPQGGPQPPMPGQASVPGGGQPGAAQSPSPQGPPQPPPNPYAAPQAPQQIDPAQEIQGYAQRIKQANPGIDDRTAYHATLKAVAASQGLAPETRALAQMQLEQFRQLEISRRTEESAASREKIATDSIAQKEKALQDTLAARDASQKEKEQAVKDLQDLKGQQAKERAQMRIGNDTQKIKASMDRTKLIQDRLDARAGTAGADKFKLNAQNNALKQATSQLTIAQRTIDSLASTDRFNNVKPEEDPQYQGAVKAAEQATQKLDLIEQSLGQQQPAAPQQGTGQLLKKYGL